MDSNFTKNVGEIVILGGAFSVNGNVNPAAEANVSCSFCSLGTSYHVNNQILTYIGFGNCFTWVFSVLPFSNKQAFITITKYKYLFWYLFFSLNIQTLISSI